MLSIRLLGELVIEVDGTPIAAPASRRARSLLGWLALHPGLQPRETVAAKFWPDVLDSSARASLRSAIWTLRRDLGDGGATHIVSTRDRIGLGPDDGLWIDSAAFDELVAGGRLEDALELRRGDLLAGLDDEWVLDARDEHRERLADVLDRLGALAEQSGDLGAAVAWSRRRVALDLLDEGASRGLIRRLAEVGDRSAALAVHAKLRQQLRQQLGISPSAQTRELVERIRAGADEPKFDGSASPWTTPPGPLIGRDREIADLERVWRAARTGGGGVVVLIGEGGIGKTRLATELLANAGSDGARTASCAALDLGGAAPFGLWAELLRDLTRELEPPPPEASWPSDLARLSPDVELRLGRIPRERPIVSPEFERARLFEAMVELVEWASRDRPLVMLLEDVHLADAPSLELAAYVGRRLARVPALMVLTRRDVPARVEVDALEQALRTREIIALEIDLGPLSSQAVARLVRATGSLAKPDVDRVVATGEGNPLLAVERARALAAGERDLPASLRGSVRASFRSLSREARLLAELAAVAARPLERAELAALALDDAAGAATHAIDSGLLVAREGKLAYRHGLLGEAVYAELSEPHRAWLHEHIAAAIRARGDRGTSRRAAEIARHLRLAGRDDLAVDHLRRAAADARAVAALIEAASFLDEAVRLSPTDPELWLELAEVEAWRGRRDRTEAAFANALEHIDPRDARAIADAWLRRGGWFGGVICSPRDSLLAAQRALDALDKAVLAAPDERAEALTLWAWAEAVAGDADRADDLLRDVHKLAGPAGASGLLARDIDVVRAQSLTRRGRFRESYGPWIAAGEAAQRAARPDLAYAAWSQAASAAACVGEFARSLEFVDRGLAAVRDSGPAVLEVQLLGARSQILARLERFDEAEQAAEAERELAELVDHAELRATSDHDGGMVALAGGDFERAETLLARALAERAPVSVPLARLARAEALARLGRCDEADAELRATALEPVSPSDFPDTLVPRLTRVQGIVAGARGDVELAERRLRSAAEGWRRRVSDERVGEGYVANLVDLGRPPVAGLIEPSRELDRVLADLEKLDAVRA